jgi:hypothetical protein
MSVAEPVAQAMGALHQIETTHGAALSHAAPAALDAVRRALGLLQAQASQHPAVKTATAAVAGSLGTVHQLVQTVERAPAHQAQPYTGAAAFAGTMAMPQVSAGLSPGEQPAPQHWEAPGQAGAAPAAFVPPTAPQQPYVPPGGHAAKGGPAIVVEADLGAHSASNFYKGLSGNDVIDSGGIFIATYQVPDVGSPVRIKVSLPGGYEFEAQGVVTWTREAPLSSSGGSMDAPPGFGARFTEISAEGRQLVYRYVRNREPLFHDDL